MRNSLLFLFIFSCTNVFSQNVGIGTNTPNINAQLDIVSTDKGLLIPRMDSLHRKAIPATAGMLVYDTDYKSVWNNDGIVWKNMGGPVYGIPSGQYQGDMLYWDGNKWEILSKPENNEQLALAFCAGKPLWGGCSLNITARSALMTTDTTATVNAVFPDNGYPVLGAGVCYATTPLPTVQQNNFVNTQVHGLTPFSFNTRIPINLSSKNYIRAFAVNAFGKISYSNEITFTPPGISYPASQKLWVPGSFQSWSPDSSPQLVSEKNDGKYEGYFYMGGAPEVTLLFLTSPDWSSKYGKGNTAFSLVPGGGDLTIPGPDLGYVLLRADIPNLTWSYASIHTWSLVDNTGVADKFLTYDNAAGVWSTTVFLNTGYYKFRANFNWDINFGDNNTGDSAPDYGGNAIYVAQAKSYVITLDLRQPGNYKYSIL
ncbi:MAG: hypothetical protein QM791_11185 [Ferruginibacter sp.]